MGRNYFGTDGIRGPVGGETMNAVFVFRLAWAFGATLRNTLGPDRPIHVVLGRDTRDSGAALSVAVVNGLCCHRVQVFDIGVAPTPAIALNVRELHADAGIVITASHNPATDNGIKFFDGKGYKLPDDAEEQIEQAIESAPLEIDKNCKGPATKHDGAGVYKLAMRTQLHQGDLEGWTIAVDAAHGATFETTPEVLSKLGADVVAIGTKPDGFNINDGIGSEHPKKLVSLVKESGARMGIAHDGDGDRVVLVDETGSVVDGDEVMAILAVDALEHDKLTGSTLVTTIMSNLGLDQVVEKAGGRVERVGVGDRYVIERMRENDYILGGESSGHFICAEHGTTGDGLLAALQVIDLMLRSGKPLSELRKVMRLFPLEKKNLKVGAKPPLESVPGFLEAVKKVEMALKPGRVLVRYSGTESKIRLLAEAEDAESAKKALQQLEVIVSEKLSV